VPLHFQLLVWKCREAGALCAPSSPAEGLLEKKSASSKVETFINTPKFQPTMKQEPDSKFIKVRCPKCKNEQILYGKVSTQVKCLVCEELLAEPTGGKSKVRGRVLEVLE
tara:strand:- start:1120 stop:1449 length:330 start_codon:yes stop_codon:yes gene_type:complete